MHTKGSHGRRNAAREDGLRDFESSGDASHLDDDIHRLLTAHGPASRPSRAAFRADLRSQFIADWTKRAQRTYALRPRYEGPWQHMLRPTMMQKATVLTAALVAVGLWLLPSMFRATPPPAISLADLSARNQRSWSAVHSVAGVFETGDGLYSEEWASWANGGPLRYKRYTQASFVDSSSGQWNISDGQTAWRIDGRTGEAVRLDRPPSGDPGDDGMSRPVLDCAALVLPAEVTGSGATPRPAIHDGRAVYIVTPPSGPMAGEVFWVDSNDSLVYRIDGADGRPKWFRRRLDLNPSLSDDIFRPESLTRL